MDDGGGCSVILARIALVVTVGMGMHSMGFNTGRIEGRCKAHAEYLMTGPDTLLFAQKNPECTDWVFPKTKGE